MRKPGPPPIGPRRPGAVALALAVTGWAAGCAAPRSAMIEPAFAARTYTPIRIALLPPDVFVVLDELGENDDGQSAALGQWVSNETARLVTDALRARGYDVDHSARWDGVVGGDGNLLVGRDELGWLAGSVLSFANSDAGGGEGPMAAPSFIAPELAARVGWATQSDALLYINIKGVTTTPGKRAAQIVGSVFIVVIVAALIAAVVLSRKNGGGGGSGRGGSSSGGSLGGAGSGKGGSVRGITRATAPSVGGGAAARTAAVPGSSMRSAGAGAALRTSPARWAGPTRAPSAGRVYGGTPSRGGGVGVDLFVPLDSALYTHDGTVTHDDEIFAGDEIYVAMTLVSASDGRVLWHVRDHADLDAEDPSDLWRLVDRFVGGLPPRGGFSMPAHTGAIGPGPKTPPPARAAPAATTEARR